MYQTQRNASRIKRRAKERGTTLNTMLHDLGLELI